MNLINSIKIKNLRKKTAIGPKKEKMGSKASKQIKSHNVFQIDFPAIITGRIAYKVLE